MLMTVRLRTWRRTLSSLVCRSGKVGAAASHCRRLFCRGMRFFPKASRDRERINPPAVPPCPFIAGLVQLPVMATAQRHGELIAHLEADGSGLGEPQVMRI